MGKEYQRHEFCRVVGCPGLSDDKCTAPGAFCLFTARQFHEWLQDNGYRIIKPSKTKK
ncbi:hypothetical protein [Desulfobacter hydrogenophilus]|uniref:hypothetical protein n=1 Tax=Desulfobacter hydrogenophilus TaxID=2291 RepID=UPI0013D5CF2B|nr:hypothetical protein [Desulfobacter hydrogenophilus]NDY73962.1 hypothetical protein [Desulfobacter hydrogenophilus]